MLGLINLANPRIKDSFHLYKNVKICQGQPNVNRFETRLGF